RGTNTSRKPKNHAEDSRTRTWSEGTCPTSAGGACVKRSPRVSTRIVSDQIDTGFTWDHARSHPGNWVSGTNAELANTNGKTRVNVAACTASTVFSDSPANAASQVNAYPTETAPTKPRRAFANPSWSRYPTR